MIDLLKNTLLAGFIEKVEKKDTKFLIPTLIILIITLVIFINILIISNPGKIINDKYKIIIVLVFIFIQLQIFFYYLNESTDETYFNNYLKFMINMGLIIGITLSSFYFMFYIVKHFFGKNIISNIVLIVLQILLVMVTLSMVYLLLEGDLDGKSKLESLNNKNDGQNITFFKNLIFYIPCMLIDLFENISLNFTNTPKVGYILLILTILLVIALLKAPGIMHNLLHKEDLLLKGPIYLNNKTELGEFQDFTKFYKPEISKYNKEYKVSNYEMDITLEKYNNKPPFSYNYEIECEIYINPQPANTNYAYNKYSNLFTYGNKPSIEYFGKENKLKVSCETNNNSFETIYEAKITNNNYFKLQKWNKFKIKYDGANMDVFINSYLVGTKKNVLPHMEYDKIIIGEDNGIYGGIKNVYFHNYNTKPVYTINSHLFDIKTNITNPFKSIMDNQNSIDISGTNYNKILPLSYDNLSNKDINNIIDTAFDKESNALNNK